LYWRPRYTTDCSAVGGGGGVEERRRRNRRKGIIIIIINFNQYLLMYRHNSTTVSYKASTITQTQKQYKYTKMKTLNKQQLYGSSKKMSGINTVLEQKP